MLNWWNRFKRWKTKAAYWEQAQATKSLHNAHGYLYRQFWWQASSKDRGQLLPENQEALDILHKLASESLERQLAK